jgi:hypothetical protein
MVKDIQNPDEGVPLNPNDSDTASLIHPVEMDLGMIKIVLIQAVETNCIHKSMKLNHVFDLAICIRPMRISPPSSHSEYPLSLSLSTLSSFVT